MSVVLDATTKKLELVLAGAVTTNQLPFNATWGDVTTTAFTPGNSDGASNGATPVDLVVAPAASTQRVIKSLNVYNADTVAATVTIRLNNNATLRNLITVTLAVGDTLSWSQGEGWQVIDSVGRIKYASGVTSYDLKGYTILTATSGTYTTPAGVRAIQVECQAPGGGGGGAGGIATGAAGGGGGASGGYACKFITSPAASYAYACPAGGTAGANTGGNGGTGGDTTFGTSLVTAKGGLGGNGMAGTNGVAVARGGNTATAGLLGDFGNYGQNGHPGFNVSAALFICGAGGNSFFGSGGNGIQTTRVAGNNGVGYGGGGSGAGNLNNATGMAGGVGGAGCIVVTEYY